MAARLSRRKLATYVAGQLILGNNAVIKELAALIVDERREREADLIVRDIQAALAENGVVLATVTSAHQLSENVKQAIRQLVGAESVVINEQIDKSVIGGIKIDIPGRRYDGTVKHKISELRAQKV